MICPPAQTIQGVQDIIYTVINSSPGSDHCPLPLPD